jgi:hypothetical protein
VTGQGTDARYLAEQIMQHTFIENVLIIVLWTLIAGVVLGMGRGIAGQLIQEHKEYRLNLQLQLAIHELYQFFKPGTVHQVSLANVREIIRRMDTVEGMTLEQLEHEARCVNRPLEDVTAFNEARGNWRIKRGSYSYGWTKGGQASPEEPGDAGSD